ncbi:MAG: hypothetical protein J6M44_15580 [Butyrivibrio sp.]|nr:hypothetical protein [Butyrivibrio sp.]
MDYERFKEGFQDALKAELAVRGADVELTARRVDKMNESYDAITVRPVDSSIGVNISVEKAFAAYENGTPIPEIAEHFADAVEKGFRESPQVDLESLSDYEQMKSKLSMEVVSAEKNAELLESVPHERMEDMAVVYRFVLDQTDSGNGTILVTNQLLDQYGMGCRYEIYTKSSVQILIREYRALCTRLESAEGTERDRVRKLLKNGVIPCLSEVISSIEMMYPDADMETIMEIAERGRRITDADAGRN